MPFVDASTQSGDSVQLHYQDFGSGRPVVLIHGWPLSGRSWEAQVPALIDAGYRVITYDRRGFGDSSQPWAGYDYDTFAADLDAVLRHLDVTDATLVGFSMGGGEVARYIGRYGTDRLSAAVFASAVPPYLYKSDDNPYGGLDDATIGQFEDGVKGDRPAFLHGFVESFFTAGDKSDLVSSEQKQFAQYLAYAASPKATLDCIAAFGRTDFRGDLEKIDIPTLVIHGDSDGIVPFEVSGKRTHEAVRGSTLVLIEGGPHGINASHADEFNRGLLDFLGGGTTSAADATAPAAATAAAPAPEQSVGRHEARDQAADDAAAADAAAAPATFLEDPNEQGPSQPTGQQAPAAATTGATAASDTGATATSDTATSDTATDTGDTAPAGSEARSEAGDSAKDPVAAALDSGFVWTTNEDQGVVPDDKAVDEKAVREGRVADPNLGDVPVDEQPHRGS